MSNQADQIDLEALTDEDDSPEAVAFRRQQDVVFRVVESAVVRKLLAKGTHPLALANVLISHGTTLLATVDGHLDAAEFLEGAAQAIRDCHAVNSTPGKTRH